MRGLRREYRTDVVAGPWQRVHCIHTTDRIGAGRAVIVEPVFGRIKEDWSFTTLSLRGLAPAKAGFPRACPAHTLGKLARVCPLPAPIHG